ncbi:MAG: nucleotidyltransferase domain-containing protein [Bacteroidales bacterium]|nr:nucleotidyltransferase domain-containing protein [Bacteroidales bacterium]
MIGTENTILKAYLPTISALCRKHNVDKLFVFGSVLTDEFKVDSDIDFVVDFNDIPLADYADNYFDLKASLQNLVGRSVDLVEYKSISNPFFLRSVDSTKQLIYG